MSAGSDLVAASSVARSLPVSASARMQQWEIDLHGHRVFFRTAGSGPPLVLVHGMVNSSRHWERVAERLAADYTVIAPDLLGHGDSAKPIGDYSLGGHAGGIRDLLSALGIERATIVGHSLGGGVAMIFFYLFPERCERLVLVSSGGLGREVSWLLRAVSLPGAGPALALAASRPVLGLARRVGFLRNFARGLAPLDHHEARRGFLCTLRSVIDMHGQTVSAHDRLYLTKALPTLIVWGDRDRTIPLEHGLAAHRTVPHSRFELLEGVGHYPHIEAPERLAAVLGDFVETTDPAQIDRDAWNRLIASGGR